MTARYRLTLYIAIVAFMLTGPLYSQVAAPPVALPPSAQPARAAQTAQTAQAAHDFDANSIRAWSLLTESSNPDQSAHDRIEALAALGTMGSNARAAGMIGKAINGHDFEVRLAAILAAGQTKNPQLIPPLQRALDDDQPQVAYLAAVTLWKMHNDSGEDLLTAVALGDRKTKPGLIKSEKHKAAKELHSPKALAMIAVNQGSGYFIGPFGVGLKAIEMVSKSSGAGARADAIDQLAQQHSDQVHEVLIQGLTDDEPAVRAASAKGLGRWPGSATAKLLLPLFRDDHRAVRLTAAAAYLRVQHNIATPPECTADGQW